jgi:hypothetical protein
MYSVSFVTPTSVSVTADVPEYDPAVNVIVTNDPFRVTFP